MDEKIAKAIETAKQIIPSLTGHDDMQHAGQAVLNLLQVKELYAAVANPTDELDKEIEFMLGKVRSNLGATALMKVTQAVLNMMQAKIRHEALCQARKPKPKGT